MDAREAASRGVNTLTYIVRYPVHIGLNNGENKQAIFLDSPYFFLGMNRTNAASRSASTFSGYQNEKQKSSWLYPDRTEALKEHDGIWMCDKLEDRSIEQSTLGEYIRPCLIPLLE